MIKILISKVEEEDNWWFNSCIPCHAEAEKVEKKFKCTECNCSFGYCEKRYVITFRPILPYKIHVNNILSLIFRFCIIILADDNTLATNVILSDRVVKRLACTTVANILKDMKKVLHEFSLFYTINFKIIVSFLTYDHQSQDSSVSVASTLFKTIIGKEVVILV